MHSQSDDAPWHRATPTFSETRKETKDVKQEKSRNRQRRNVTLGSRRTSVSLEDQVWDGLTDICRREEIGLDQLCTAVDRRRVESSLSSALRVFLLTYFRHAAERLEASAAHGAAVSPAAPAALPAALPTTLPAALPDGVPVLLDAVLERLEDEQNVASGRD